MDKEKSPFATDQECVDRRRSMVFCGIIKPAKKSDFIFEKSGLKILSTRKKSRQKRRELIDSNIICTKPCEQLLDDSTSKLKPEGEYSPRPIENETDYLRKRNVYFRIIQEILWSRKQLKLALGKKHENDPGWYF